MEYIINRAMYRTHVRCDARVQTPSSWPSVVAIICTIAENVHCTRVLLRESDLCSLRYNGFWCVCNAPFHVERNNNNNMAHVHVHNLPQIMIARARARLYSCVLMYGHLRICINAHGFCARAHVLCVIDLCPLNVIDLHTHTHALLLLLRISSSITPVARFRL